MIKHATAGPIVPDNRPSWLGRKSHALVGAAALAGGLVLTGVPQAAPASAATSFRNAAVADTFLKYVGRNGVEACKDARMSTAYPGECKQTLNCVLKMASGGAVNTGGGYYEPYQRAGGKKVTAANATKGDVIQLNGPDRERFYGGMHTAVIVKNLGNGNFDVVDSNINDDGMVNHHQWDPYKRAKDRGLTVNIWRFGRVSGSEPSTSQRTWSFKTNTPAVTVRSGPGTGHSKVGTLGKAGTTVKVVKQCLGTAVHGNRVWDQIVSPVRGWVADYFVSTGVQGWYPGIPRC